MVAKLVARPGTSLVINVDAQGGAPDIEALPTGGYVVVWGGRSPIDGNRASANVQIVDATGALVDMNADERYTNFFIPQGGGDPNANAGFNAQVSAFADGGFVVAYIDTTYGGQGGATFAQFDEFGDFELGPQIATVRLSPSADVVAIGNDDYFVSFYGLDGSSPDRVLYQHVDRGGGEGELPAQLDRTDFDARALATSVTRHGDGFITVWTDADADPVSPENGQLGVSGAILDKDGLVIKRFDVNGAAPLAQFIDGTNAVVSLEGGGFAVLYGSTDPFGGSTPNSHALVSVFRADGTAIARDIAVSPDVEGAPEICALPGGGFIVAWNGIRAQLFDARGGLVGEPTTLVEGFFPSNPTLEVLNDGTIVLGYTELDGAVKTLEFDLAQVRDGTEGPDNLLGSKADDQLNGLGASDTLTGRDGADTLDGGDGPDTAAYVKSVTVDLADAALNTGEAIGDVFISIEDLQGGDFADRLFGDEFANQIYGGGGADLLEGRGGNDTLNATVDGADTLRGGMGNDTYIIFHGGGVKVDEASFAGLDTVVTFVDYADAVTGQVEVFIAATPRELDRNIDLTGNAIANRLVGNSGANRLDGGAAPDSLEGGNGNDVYIIDNPADRIVEERGARAGDDRAEVKADYILRAGVFLERMDAVEGFGPLSLTGNETDNQIYGNKSANKLFGSGGDDSLYGGQGKDSLEGGDGRDYLFAGDTSRDTLGGGAGDDTYEVINAGHVFVEAEGGGDDRIIAYSSLTLSRGVEIETLEARGNQIIDLTGNGVAQRLIGNQAANRLDGKGGADTMVGGDGSDSYVVDDAGDSVVEAETGTGLDIVISSVDFSLSNRVYVEALVAASGAKAIDLSGNRSNNTLDGNDGANELDGGRGNDTLEGGGGGDTFIFAGDFGLDRVEDFAPGQDVLKIDYGRVDTFEEVMALAVRKGGNVVITFDETHRITLEDVTRASLSADDFAFF